MDDILKLSEEDIKLRYITPAILNKGWAVTDITMETKVKLTDGKINQHTIIRLPGSIFAPYTSIATNILFFDNDKAEGAAEGFCTKETWFYRLDMPEGYKHFSKTKPMQSAHCQPIRDWWNHRTEMADEISGDTSSVPLSMPR